MARRGFDERAIEERVAEVASSWKGAGARRSSDSVARGARHSVHDDAGTGRVRRSSMAEVAQQALQRRASIHAPPSTLLTRRKATERRQEYSDKLHKEQMGTRVQQVFHVKKRSITLMELKNMKAFFNELKDGSGLVTVQNLRKDKDSRANAGLQTAGTQMGADLFVGKVKAYLEKRPTQKGISFGGHVPGHRQAVVARRLEQHHLRERGAERKEELLKLMFTVNDEMVEKMIAALTPDVENAPIKFKAMSREQRQWLDDMWDLWDADGSGELDKYELQEALRLLGVHDRADFDELYAQIDLDDSGYIDKDEFGAWWFDLERDVD